MAKDTIEERFDRMYNRLKKRRDKHRGAYLSADELELLFLTILADAKPEDK